VPLGYIRVYIRVWCIIKIILDAFRLLAETFISLESNSYYFKQLLLLSLLSWNYFDKEDDMIIELMKIIKITKLANPASI